MSWLIYNPDESKVVVAPEAMVFDEIQTVYKHDRRNKDKPYFNKVITYIYHAYAKDHKALGHLFPTERKKRVCNKYFAGEDVTVLEKDKDVKALISFYIKDSGTIAENFYEGIKGDMEELLEHIRSIPMKIKHRIKRKVTVDFIDEEGNKRSQDVYIDMTIETDNSDEKLSAIKRAETLIDLEAKIRTKVIQELKEKKRISRRLFDR